MLWRNLHHGFRRLVWVEVKDWSSYNSPSYNLPFHEIFTFLLPFTLALSPPLAVSAIFTPSILHLLSLFVHFFSLHLPSSSHNKINSPPCLTLADTKVVRGTAVTPKNSRARPGSASVTPHHTQPQSFNGSRQRDVILDAREVCCCHVMSYHIMSC